MSGGWSVCLVQLCVIVQKLTVDPAAAAAPFLCITSRGVCFVSGVQLWPAVYVAVHSGLHFLCSVEKCVLGTGAAMLVQLVWMGETGACSQQHCWSACVKSVRNVGLPW